MDSDHAMDDNDDVVFSSAHFVQHISATEFEREAVEYTTQEVQRLNAAVREQPEIGARSEFFRHEANVVKGLPVFQGKHTRFVYDDDEEEIVAAVEVTEEALRSGPVVRTVADLEEEEEEDEEDEEAGQDGFDSADQESNMVVEDSMNALMEDVEMEMAAVAIDEQKLMDAAARNQ